MTSSHFCLDRRLSDWSRRAGFRYRVAGGAPLGAPSARRGTGSPAASRIAVGRWDKLSRISAHISSGRLLARSELYVSFYATLCCFGGVSPVAIRSKRAVAGFGVMRGAITGLASTLRGRSKGVFCYKWAFLEPALFAREKAPARGRHALLGVSNVFAFPELERFNYNLFAPVNGLDLGFHYDNAAPAAATGTTNAEKTT